MRGVYVALPFPAGGDDPVSAGRRAFATIADTTTPNTIVVDIDCDDDLVLRHDLVPERAGPSVP